MAKAKKKAAPKKRADHYEEKVKTALSFDELITMSVNKNQGKRKLIKRNENSCICFINRGWNRNVILCSSPHR